MSDIARLLKHLDISTLVDIEYDLGGARQQENVKPISEKDPAVSMAISTMIRQVGIEISKRPRAEPQ